MTIADLLEAAVAKIQRTIRGTALPDVEAKLEQGMARVFKAQAADYLRRFERARHRFREASTPEDALWWETAAATAPEMQRVIEVALRRALGAGVVSTAAGLADLEELSVSDNAVRYLQEHGAELVTGINGTTQARLQTILVNALESGQSWAATAKQVRETFEGFTRSRAKVIAVQESALAYSEGQRVVATHLQRTGIPMRKRWLDAGDHKVDSPCADNASVGWIDFNDSFPSGAGAPPEHVGCRCDLAVEPAV